MMKRKNKGNSIWGNRGEKDEGKSRGKNNLRLGGGGPKGKKAVRKNEGSAWGGNESGWQNY